MVCAWRHHIKTFGEEKVGGHSLEPQRPPIHIPSTSAPRSNHRRPYPYTHARATQHVLTMLRGGLSLARLAVGKRGGFSCQIPKRSYAALTDLEQLPRPGDKLHGFTVQRAKSVPELQLAAVQLQHDKTGAGYIHVARDDKNNVFAIGFKTNPNDDTGVPHILEHTTLCGSEKCAHTVFVGGSSPP